MYDATKRKYYLKRREKHIADCRAYRVRKKLEIQKSDYCICGAPLDESTHKEHLVSKLHLDFLNAKLIVHIHD